MHVERKGKLIEKNTLAEAKDHFDFSTQFVGHLWIDPATIPEGMTYAWFIESVLDQPDARYLKNAFRMGWKPVPADRHPELMPEVMYGGLYKDADRSVIRTGGQILMETPTEHYNKIQEGHNKVAQDRTRRALWASDEYAAKTNMPWETYGNDTSYEVRNEILRPL